METRKVQLAGGTTYTVSIPKEWANEHGVSAGTVLELYLQDDSIVAAPRKEDNQTKGTIDIGTEAGEKLLRTVVAMYINGFDTVTIEAPGLSTDQRRGIRRAANRLSGWQVIEETTDRVRLRYLLDRDAVSAADLVDQMHIVAGTMLEDAVRALLDGDEALAAEIQDRDDELDRMYALLLRSFRSSLREPGANEHASLDRVTYFEYHTCARQLERVGDHAAKIAGLVSDLDDVPESVADQLEAMYGTADGIVNAAVEALFEEDPDEVKRVANEALAEVDAVDTRARDIEAQLREHRAEQARLLGIAVDSLSRTAEYGGNIAESALQQAAPSP